MERATTLDPNLLALISARSIGALATIKGDGRPQLSTVNFTLNTATTTARVSMIDGLAKVKKLRRDPRDPDVSQRLPVKREPNQGAA